MAQDPSFLLYYKDILVSCADWDPDVLGWYLRLLCHQADKQAGLENNLETLASLAGVKISQYERFVFCWKRTLKAKWAETKDGTLINLKLAEVIESRKNFSEKQQIRGLIGFYVKKFLGENNASEPQGKRFAKMISAVLKLHMTNEEKENAYKRTLIAFFGNAIGNTDNKKEDEGVGEEEKKSAESCLPTNVMDVDLLRQKVLLDEDFKREFEQPGRPLDKLEEWLKNFNKFLRFGGSGAKTEKDYRWHFGNWMAKQTDVEHPENYKILKDGNDNSTKPLNGISGTSADRLNALRKF